jgi:hypothetical protein
VWGLPQPLFKPADRRDLDRARGHPVAATPYFSLNVSDMHTSVGLQVAYAYNEPFRMPGDIDTLPRLSRGEGEILYFVHHINHRPRLHLYNAGNDAVRLFYSRTPTKRSADRYQHECGSNPRKS